MFKQKTILMLSVFFIFSFVGLDANAGWWPFSKNSKDVQVHAYFYFPDGKEVYLGQQRGAASCQYAAIDFARSKNIERERWDYICCTIEKGSDCYRKIR